MKKWIHSLAVFLICLSLFVATQAVTAKNTNKLTLQFEQQVTSPITFQFWWVGLDEESLDIEVLNQKTDEDLNQTYPQFFLSKNQSEHQLVLDDLPDGVYIGRIQSPDPHHLLASNPLMLVELPYQGQTELVIHPKLPQFANLRIQKIGEVPAGNSQQWEPLKGVQFALYPQGGQEPLKFKAGQFTTDAEGKTIIETDVNGQIHLSGLSAGQYLLVEEAGPAGYALAEPQKLTLTAHQTTEITVKNYRVKEGGQHFRKVSAQNKQLGLPGAVFELTQWDEEKQAFVPVRNQNGDIQYITSDQEGYFEVNHLSFGDYYLVEVKAPDFQGVRYQPLKEAVAFTIDSQSYSDRSVLAIVNQPQKNQEQSQQVVRPQKPGPSMHLPSTGELAPVSPLLIIALLAIGLHRCFYQERSYR